jgi:photosystem II stability/assembly factor-like uncharacterized protein
MKSLTQIFLALTLAFFCLSCSAVPSAGYNPWQVLSLDTDATFADIGFTDDPNHGWLVGTKASLFETTDGGQTWRKQTLELEGEKISFTAISFDGKEGWITGEPSILLHTEDGGVSWSRIPLSEKLPGAPFGVVALAPHSAEMVTNLGAIYKTTDGGRSWKALVEGSVGVARTISRSPEGRYVAVSARGNFYSTWEPGQSEWAPHNRNSSRRLQTMGYGKDGRLWLLARGGQLQFSTAEDFEKWEETLYPELSTSWGLLDLAYRTPQEIWVAGGSANLLVSADGGATWQKDREVEEVPSNFYKVLFLSPDQGFVLGQAGYLLKYNPASAAAPTKTT